MDIIELKAFKTTPDIVHEYTPNIKNDVIPLVIDNGSYECRVGWACNDDPLMIFRNLIAKPRKEKMKKDGEVPTVQPTQIGNDIINIEAMRYQLRTQFDRNVVTHYQNQEQIFDYIFKHLGIDTEGRIQHPIVLTECLANPNYCRQVMSELLFECYDIPSVTYGIDSLFSFYHNKIGDNGLIISFGYHTTHVIPILNRKVQLEKIRRLNIGGFHMITFLHRLLQLKYPVHANALLLSRIEWLLHTHCFVAYDYLEELRKWSKLDFYEKNVKIIQLPFNATVTNTTLTAEQKMEKKRELAKRLAEINARKREEKLVEDENQLKKLLSIKQHSEKGENREFQRRLRQNLISSKDELEKLIQAVANRVDRTKQKMEESATNTTFPFEEKEKIPQPPAHQTIVDWVAETKQKRSAILERRNSRRQRKQDLAKRRTAAAQERMRIISQLARKEKGDDDFGMRDEDWDVYKAISKDGDSDSETENEKLIEFEEILRHHDPTFEEPQIVQEGTAESYQLHLGVEQIRAPELLFQPSMIGSSEAGITETIGFVLKLFTADEQLSLAQNIFLTGSCAKFLGLTERLSREMTEIRPFQTLNKIHVASDVSVDAWRGARDFANSSDISKYLITKEDYIEMGGEYLKEHYASNRYFSTPAPIGVETATLPLTSTASVPSEAALCTSEVDQQAMETETVGPE